MGGDASGNGNSVIESNGGNIVIEGGFFYTDYAYEGFYYVLNQKKRQPRHHHRQGRHVRQL